MPALRPVGFRVHWTEPLPVPEALVSWVQPCRADALQAVVALLSPLSVTVAEVGSPAVAPAVTVSRLLEGATARASGTGGGGGTLPSMDSRARARPQPYRSSRPAAPR